MKTKELSFELPEELIAQTPAAVRGDDRMLVINRLTGEWLDRHISDFPDYVSSGSLLIVNDSKVRKARVFADSETGGKVEFLFLEENSDQTWTVMTSKTKRQKIGKSYSFSETVSGKQYASGRIVAEKTDGTRVIELDKPITEEFFSLCGHVPLPPYIKREADFSDEKRYQTVYATNEGSVASPTAGLHFTRDILDRVVAKGCEIVRVTLHVGPGTFLPVRTENLEEHPMHFERYEISVESAEKINAALREGREIICTGTTSIRTVESAFDASSGMVRAGFGRTNLFIMPGYHFNVADKLLTNFHIPESTLLALVCAFAGKEHILSAYRHAVDERYRFYSYGDATFLI